MNHKSFKSLSNESYELLTLIHALSGNIQIRPLIIYFILIFRNSLDLIYYDGNSRLQSEKSYDFL